MVGYIEGLILKLGDVTASVLRIYIDMHGGKGMNRN